DWEEDDEEDYDQNAHACGVSSLVTIVRATANLPDLATIPIVNIKLVRHSRSPPHVMAPIGLHICCVQGGVKPQGYAAWRTMTLTNWGGVSDTCGSPAAGHRNISRSAPACTRSFSAPSSGESAT